MDGILGFKEEATLKRIDIRLAQKCKEPYSRNCGYVKGRVEITLVRANHHFIQRSRFPASHISVTRPHWEDSTGFHLFR